MRRWGCGHWCKMTARFLQISTVFMWYSTNTVNKQHLTGETAANTLLSFCYENVYSVGMWRWKGCGGKQSSCRALGVIGTEVVLCVNAVSVDRVAGRRGFEVGLLVLYCVVRKIIRSYPLPWNNAYISQIYRTTQRYLCHGFEVAAIMARWMPWKRLIFCGFYAKTIHYKNKSSLLVPNIMNIRIWRYSQV